MFNFNQNQGLSSGSNFFVGGHPIIAGDLHGYELSGRDLRALHQFAADQQISHFLFTTQSFGLRVKQCPAYIVDKHTRDSLVWQRKVISTVILEEKFDAWREGLQKQLERQPELADPRVCL